MWALPLTGDRKPLPLVTTPLAELQGRLSPNGRWLAFVSHEPGRQRQVYVESVPPSGGKWRLSTGGGVQPRWSGDGKELFFLGGSAGAVGGGEPVDVMVVDVDASNADVFRYGVPQKLFGVVPHSVVFARNSWDVTPDGQWFLVAVNSTATAVPPVHVVVNWLTGMNTR